MRPSASRLAQIVRVLHHRSLPHSTNPVDSLKFRASGDTRRDTRSQGTESAWKWIEGLRISIIGQPRIVRVGESVDMPPQAFYAVQAGYTPGIYRTWAEAERQVKGYPGAKFKKFPTERGAKEFISPTSSAYPTSAHSRSTPGTKGVDQSKSPSTSPSTSKSIPKSSTTTPSHSPPTHAPHHSLPPHLQALSWKGYLFSEGTPHRLVVYTDGSGLGNGKVGARAGVGVWWGPEGEAGEKGLAERVPGEVQTNNRGELLSVIRALETCPFPDLPLEVRTDSQYTISCMTTYLPKWLETNFRLSKPSSSSSYSSSADPRLVKNTDLIKHMLVLLRRRDPNAGVRFKYVPAHVGWVGNEGADRLAKLGASKPAVRDRSDWLDPDVDDDSPVQAQAKANALNPVNVEVQIDESWLMTAEELTALEQEFRRES